MWKWLKNHISLTLLLAATCCLAWAIGGAVRGTPLPLCLTVALTATLCGWLAGKSRMNNRQAAGWLIVPGISGVFLSVTGLLAPLRAFFISSLSILGQSIFRVYTRNPVDYSPLVATWSDLLQRFTSVLSRLGEWGGALAAGKVGMDPVVTGLVWSILLWLVGIWSGWQLCRNHQALRALAPGGLVIALVLDYTNREISPLLGYLVLILMLLGLSRIDALHISWRRRGIDYSDSIAFDSISATIVVTILLVGLAMVTPSFSWQELAEMVRERTSSNDRLAESLGLDESSEPAHPGAYDPTGLPRQHLVGTPPDYLQDLVMTVSTGELPPMPNVIIPNNASRHYWRTTSFDVYNGAGWSSSVTRNIPLPANGALMEIPPGSRVVRQQIHVLAGRNERVYWTGTLIQADVDLEIAWRSLPPSVSSPGYSGDMLGALTTTNRYSVVSIEPNASITQLRAAGSDYPPEVTRYYLQLPKSVPERVLDLAHELTATAPTPSGTSALAVPISTST